jgi:IclR family transcriptional regulator, KDG regulon repressor
VLLAYQNEKEIERLCSIGFKAFTPHTLTEPEVLLSELATIKKNGYAFSKEEFKVGICSLAVPVFDEMTNQIIAAISVTGPKEIISPSQTNIYLSEMRMYSRLISEQMSLDMMK